jgi:hypothetical protein
VEKRGKKSRAEDDPSLREGKGATFVTPKIKMKKASIDFIHFNRQCSQKIVRSAMHGNDHLFFNPDAGCTDWGVDRIMPISSPVCGSTIVLDTFFVLRTVTLGRPSFFAPPAVATDSPLQPCHYAVGVDMLQVIHLERETQALFDTLGALCPLATAPDEDTRKDTARKG